jgi:uncharacterized protein with HEPN domain
MPRDQEALIDILVATQRILRYAVNIDRAELETNDEKLSAILYQISIMGEASKRISPAFCQQHPQIPWRDMAGMRDIIVHAYDQVDLDVVWDVITQQLIPLQDRLESLISQP